MLSENVQATKHVVIQEQPGMKPRKSKGGKKKPDVVSKRYYDKRFWVIVWIVECSVTTANAIIIFIKNAFLTFFFLGAFFIF